MVSVIIQEVGVADNDDSQPLTLLKSNRNLCLTWHCEVLSVYDLIFSIVELVIVFLCVSVQIL